MEDIECPFCKKWYEYKGEHIGQDEDRDWETITGTFAPFSNSSNFEPLYTCCNISLPSRLTQRRFG